MPEFLKKIFGEKPMTFDEFETAYKAQESAKDGIKLVNLTEGGYVDKGKFDGKVTELKTATDNLSALQETVKKFDGVDVEKLKTAAADAQKKFDADLAAAKRDSAVDLMLVQAGARSVKAARALLDLSKVKLALFIEAIVNVLKPIWDKSAGKITIAELASMGVGIVIALVAKLNFMADVVNTTEPVLLYLMYALTGVALGRGPSFVYDLWQKIRAQQAE